ncbi:hypothetical protein ACJRO7_007748 [Eucalyptus globulus]|uniref:Mediator of RNA polymerase II transcription subunit 11 n=1 Tax=Eucalyptus globulus TaxID=34317 RepID=A0ABD3IP40_EUCGL
MDSPTENTSLHWLQNVEKRIIKVLELASGVMNELASPAGPRKEFINNHCREFMQLIKDIQKSNYSSRVADEICLKKLKYVISQLDGMKETIEKHDSEA